MEHRVENLLKMERSEPKNRLAVSDGALYVVVLVSVIAAVMLSYDLAERFDWPRSYVQLALYAVLIAAGYGIYRFRLLSYRYMLTDKTLRIDRITGSRERLEAQIDLQNIVSVQPVQNHAPRGAKRLHAGAGGDATLILFQSDGKETALVLALSEDFLKELLQQWKKDR